MTNDVGEEASRELSDIPWYTIGLPRIGPTLGTFAEPLTFHLDPARRFGSMYRMHFLGKRWLVMAGLDANEFIWSHDNPWEYRRPLRFFVDAYGEKALTQLKGAEHKEKRRRLGAAMRPRQLTALAPRIHDLVLEELRSVDPGPIDLREFCERIVPHIQSRALFDLRFPPDLELRIRWLENHNLRGAFLGPLRHVHYRHPRYRSGMREIEHLLGEAIDRRLASPIDEPDLLSVVTSAFETDDAAASRQELIYELKELLFAGASTESNQILWLLMYLAADPAWVDELREELAGLDPENFVAITDFPKLLATLLEVERLRPAGAFFFRHASDDFVFDGVRVPAGTRVLHATLVPHFDPDLFEQPMEFRPRRHLETVTDRARYASVFGGGPHKCLGMPLARLESAMAATAVLHHFDIEMEPISMRAKLAPTITPREQHIPARFVPR